MFFQFNLTRDWLAKGKWAVNFFLHVVCTSGSVLYVLLMSNIDARCWPMFWEWCPGSLTSLWTRAGRRKLSGMLLAGNIDGDNHNQWCAEHWVKSKQLGLRRVLWPPLKTSCVPWSEEALTSLMSSMIMESSLCVRYNLWHWNQNQTYLYKNQTLKLLTKGNPPEK